MLAVVSFVLALSAAPAVAAEAPTTVCTVSDKRITELSGLVSDGQRWYAINDGGTKLQVFVLGRDCAVQRVITNSLDPYDVEDLARASDGTLWLSDTGDNDKKRETVALEALTPQGKATLYRLTYPDGQHDGEALLLDRAGTPYLVTKTPFGDSGIYRPAAQLQSPGPTPLEKVGTLDFRTTDTPGGPVAGFGSVLVTGGATSADGTVVALRTYTDAYLYSAPDGDIAAALKREPVRVPLPNEKQGEALAFEPDGTLLSGGEGVGQPIKAVRGATALVTPATEDGTPAAAGGEAAAGKSAGKGMGTGPALLLAVCLAGGGLFVITKLRRRFSRR
ncbi:esterase-like activity of phytase family protein [Amycolatopsis bartoniae]|nr:esterase-like activity of phytase family protein [Amycolatopsis bartoniae]